MINLIACIILQFLSQSFLRNETTVIEYCQNDQGDYYAYVYPEGSSNKKRHVDLCTAAALDGIDVGAEIYRGKKSSHIYELLVRPLETYLSKKVVFRPVGKIHFINMFHYYHN